MKFVLLLFLFIASSVFGGESADLYRNQENIPPDGATQSQSLKDGKSDKHGFTEIGLERTECYGTCPAYTITKHSG